MTCPATPLPVFRPQRGAALIIAMILLLVMSLLAVASLRGTLMQERMSANTHDRDLAFQSAEAGLRMGEQQAENWVRNGATPDWPSCLNSNAGGLYKNINECEQPLWEGPAPGSSGTFWHDANSDTDISFNSAGLSLAPFYIVELISNQAPCNIDEPDKNPTIKCRRFRVTASSRSTDGRAQVVLQSIYATQ
ncbi:MAG: PilX N-terminal domain-containing pilus assembly protein [Betaproteobacteria bacterium]|nr:PilX N-terminal domain-containing pilus assembly protein [Betaproteobacteria bacterium]